jgi:hypothetical protein
MKIEQLRMAEKFGIFVSNLDGMLNELRLSKN